jgi:hypothetical protein
MLFKHLGILVAAPMLIAAPGEALAQAKPDSGITYDCDTAADHYSELVLPAGAAPFTVTGKVKLMNVVASTDYVPMARLAISNAQDQPGPSSQGWTGFEFLVAPAAKGKQPTISALAYSRKEEGKKTDMEIFGTPGATEVPFSLVYDGTQVAMSVDGHEKQFAFTAARPVVRIVCSTGEFLFSNLVIRPQG